MRKDVVLLHGFLESPKIWEHFIQFSEPQLRSINLQLPNHNPKETKDFPIDLNEQAEQLHRTLIKLEVENPVLIGHSLGGYLALAYIEKYAAHTSGIALINTTCLADDEERKAQRNRAIRLIENYPKAFIQMAIKNLFTKTGLNTYTTEIEWLISDAKKLSVSAIQASLIAMRDRKDRSDVLKNFDGKKLFIYGKNDPLISVEANKKAINKSHCPSIALNAGHMGWLEDKENLNEILLEFINR